tara:strand:+ start:404 stop:1024 length:621 start_codon:yes stop_codon:yes gene_type:complete
MIYRLLKRAADLFCAIILLIILSPLFLLIAFLIYFDNGLPIFYVQKRIGLKNKLFRIFKFRTMIKNAEKDELGYMCYEGDKRITKVGKILRKYSLDELPQLINILKGEMSFVGPRPAVFDEFERENLHKSCDKYLKIRSLFKPGLTGFVQIHGRNELTWNKKLAYDKLYYYKVYNNQLIHFIIDSYILIATFYIIFSDKGEYDPRQ